ncbi:MAG: MerR family transcriptional regulator [Verrucomicrobia bacterium]|nr:MerR family transcriptional regulator [Verrucomicrobiota bacterium]
MNVPHHSIRAVAKRTGLSPHVIRVWEKRYQAVEPTRTATNRRLYSDAEIERLSLLRDITNSGHTIGNVAALPTEKLREIAHQTHQEPVSSRAMQPATSHASSPGALLVAECIEAVKALNPKALQDVLVRGSVLLGLQGLLQVVVAPLAQALGELWRDGTITAAHEHFATAVLRTQLGQMTKGFAEPDNAPSLIVSTPAGQLHELGALLAGATASSLGWRVAYLGTSLPAAEIAGAAIQRRARAVALSIVYPEDDPRLESELTRLRELLPAHIEILVGGRAMNAYRPALDRIGAHQIRDLNQLSDTLDNLRKPSHLTRE